MQKFQERFSGPWKVLRSLPHSNYELINLKTLKSFRCHVNRIKPGHFREQLYKETGPTEPLVQKEVRRSPRLNPAAGPEDGPGLDADDEPRQNGGWQPIAPASPRSTGSLTTPPGSLQNTPSTASSQSLQSRGEGVVVGSGSAPGSAPGSSPSNGPSQHEGELRTLTPQSRDRLSSELQQVKERRLAVEEELQGLPLLEPLEERGAEALPPPQPPPIPPPRRQPKRKAKQPARYFGDEYENFMIACF